MNNQNVTYIDELPELDDLGPYSGNDNTNIAGLSMIPNDIAEKYQKVIRNNHIPSPESGMYYHEQYNQPQQYIDNQISRKIPSKFNNLNNSFRYEKYTPTAIIPNQPNQHAQNYINNEIIEHPIKENFNSFNCLDVANHVKSCPICSKFYNTDKTPYIIAIVILSIICILLLKKVLNM
jgi:hypothetical protein